MPKDAKDAGEKPPDPTKWKKCAHEGCTGYALFLADFCWEHLPYEIKIAYKGKIEEWIKAGRSLDGANLSQANFQCADFKGAFLHKANLYGADLRNANLEEANLRKANLRYANLDEANLQGAKISRSKLKLGKTCNHEGCRESSLFLEDFCWNHLSDEAKATYKTKIEKRAKAEHSLHRANFSFVDLRGIDLEGAILNNANFYSADLRGANLAKAVLSKAIFAKADLRDTDLRQAILSGTNLKGTKLHGAYMKGISLQKALYLSWEYIRKVGEDMGKEWRSAKFIYLYLKNHFGRNGDYRSANKAYYREKLMAKKDAQSQKQFLRWLGLSIFHILTGFGERWWWTALWALGLIAFFGVVYWLGTEMFHWFKFAFEPAMIPSIFQYFYLSVVTFATLGFGAITPLNWQAQIPVVIEVIMGYVFLGLIITIIARRFGR